MCCFLALFPLAALVEVANKALLVALVLQAGLVKPP